MNFNINNSVNNIITIDFDKIDDIDNIERHSSVRFDVYDFLERIEVEEEINLENFKAFISGNGSKQDIKSGYIELTCLSSLKMNYVCDELDMARKAYRKLADKKCEVIFVY